MGQNSKDIKNRIRSIQNTQKVTSSMKLISTIKLQQFQKALANTKQYKIQLASLLRKVLLEMLNSQNELPKLLKTQEKASKVCLLVVSADRGLCGGYNAQICKFLNAHAKKYTANHKEVELVLIGKKIDSYCKKFLSSYKVLEFCTNNNFEESLELHELLQKLYLSSEYSNIELIYTEYQSAIKFSLSAFQLFPLAVENLEQNQESTSNLPILMEPDLSTALEKLLVLYAADKIREAVFNARASEMANRVNAMSAATDNAKKLINELTLVFNKARQSSITQEISEIVVGVESMKVD